ncbi:MAG: hypothetical protein ABI134_36080, partial [Byssovorax sp.]
MKMKMMLASGLGIMLAVGCSESVETNPPGSGGSSSSSSNTTTGSTSVSTGTGGTCPGFEDATGTDTVTVRFRNNTTSAVYLPVSCESINFAIDPVTGPDGVTYSYDGSCLQTCEDLQKSPPFACGACAPRAFRLDVGATREVTWEGAGLKSGVSMPASCWAAPGSDKSCSQVVAAAAASYRISALGFASCGATCACDAQGVCAGSAEGA